MELSDPERRSWDGRRNRGRAASTVWLVGVSVATRFPDDALDVLFTVGAQVFSETRPVETCEAAPQVASDPIFARLNFSSADNASVDV